MRVVACSVALLLTASCASETSDPQPRPTPIADAAIDSGLNTGVDSGTPPVMDAGADASHAQDASPTLDSAIHGDASSAPDASAPHGDGFYHMEALDRGLVAIADQSGAGNHVSFRMYGPEYSHAASGGTVVYELLRDGVVIETLASTTHTVDPTGTGASVYSVRAVIDGAALAASETATVWSEPFLRIPLEKPASGTTPGSPTCETPNEAFSYHANDASVGDLDGDGSYEIVLKWDPSNAKDNSQSGCTGPVLIDAYTLSGERLWRIDLGPNIRAGAHYTQLIVYDLDGDGRAEVACKTAPGTRDGSGAFLSLGPAASDDDARSYRSIDNDGSRTGYVLTGPEYLSVFDGLTGSELATQAFAPERGSVSSWGDGYGNRVDRFLAGVAYVDDTGLPSFVMARGYYTRTTLTAWKFRDGALTEQWRFDSNATGSDAQGHPFTGQGSHSLSIANVDSDKPQEIVYGAMAIDHDGTGLCSTGYGHGDALHVSDFVPSRPGLEAFMPHEDGEHPMWDLRDARTCEILQEGPVNGEDTGRGVIADVDPDSAGAELWTSGGTPLRSTVDGSERGATPSSINFLVWWDGDDSRELLDDNRITELDGDVLESCDVCDSNNGTKATPALSADLLGDYREEVIWRETDDSALRIYATTLATERRIYTLMHDPQYRVAIAWQNVAYNQPPHPSFHIGANMIAPPAPDIVVRSAP